MTSIFLFGDSTATSLSSSAVAAITHRTEEQRCAVAVATLLLFAQGLTTVPKHLKCLICLLPCRETVLLSSCGHKYCETCIHNYFSAGSFVCPEDKRSLDYAKIYPDPATDEAVLKLQLKCPSRKQGCNWTGQLKALPDHSEECPFDVIECPNQCLTRSARQNMAQHILLTCPKRKLPCPHCSDFFASELLEDHSNHCPKELLYCEKKCGEQLQRHLLPNHEMNECPKRVLPCPYNCGRDFGYDTLPGHLPSCPKYPLLRPNSSSMTNLSRADLLVHLADGCTSSVLSCPLKELGCRFKGLSLKMDQHLAKTQLNHFQLLMEAYTKQKSHIQILSSAVNHLQASHDGVLLWKISNFSVKFDEAKAKDGCELQSPVFYSARYGYKLQATLFLNGNGEGEGKYLSVYIKLLAGEYDALLSWPFRLPIGFTLLDQSPDLEKRVHVKEFFVPDPSCKLFHRPLKSCKMLGFGHAKFVSHEMLRKRNYVREDVIFVKVKASSSNGKPE